MLGALGKIGVVGNGVPLPRRVRTILNKYGATMLLPGVSGAMRFGYQPGNYRESTGQTLAAADQQVGLVVDAARVPVAMTAPSTGGTAGWASYLCSISSSGGNLTATNTSTSEGYIYFQQGNITAGRAYEVQFEVVARTLTQGTLQIGQTSTLVLGLGIKTVRAVATNTHGIWIGVGGTTIGNSMTIRNVVLRELPGIHASQSTSGFQPVLRNSGGIQSWQFDGTDDRLQLSAVPFQMSDDHFVVAGATRGGIGVTRRVFHVGSGGDIPRVACLSFSSAGIPEVNYRNDSGNFVLVTGDTEWPQSPVVLSATSIATALRLRADSALLATGARPSGATTLTAAAVGAHTAGTAYFNGNIHGVIFGKGAISDAELLTLERFVASLQGRTL